MTLASTSTVTNAFFAKAVASAQHPYACALGLTTDKPDTLRRSIEGSRYLAPRACACGFPAVRPLLDGRKTAGLDSNRSQPRPANFDMRLPPHARSVIRRTTTEVFGPHARVLLFGSRVDDRLRGGDIDLLIELPEPDADKNRHSLTLAARLQQELGDQRIDVIVLDPATPEQPIHRQARATGIPL